MGNLDVEDGRSMPGAELKPKRCAIPSILSCPSSTPSFAKAVLQDIASACSRVVSVPPQSVELPIPWLEPGAW